MPGRAEIESIVQFMREFGVVELSGPWGPGCDVYGIKLGPAPGPPFAPHERATQPDMSNPSATEQGREHEQLRAQVAQRLRTQYAASGAVVTAEEISRELARVVAARAR